MADRRTIRVLFVDDDRGFLEALEALFADDERFEIVGTAADGSEAVARAVDLRPDVVTMDLEMPRMDGVEATRRIRAELPDTRVVVVSSSAYATRAEMAREAGASAYVTKSAVADELLPTVVAVAGGESFGDSELAPTLQAKARRLGTSHDDARVV